MMPCVVVSKHIRDGKYDRMILPRPLVPISSESIGHLPGTVDQKVFRCLYMYDFRPFPNKIETVPLGYIRGSTWDNSWIIADEMQNSSPAQMKSVLTRLGQNSNLI